ncbi:uncharacterized protein LOC123535810 [Mercenaria mercenaria]|uniref:uncharacterized protein LOC123535810 n=1 Tax=Mercenaria mercenaria TaxID=6596 RepID=UPI00234F11CA|nr:uncharacterized protein LOC123535810 [Mercenaria mercenaria]
MILLFRKQTSSYLGYLRRETMASSIVSSKEKEELTENHPVVAAIDIGTTSTCFALSFANNPTKLITSKWTSVSTLGDKAPTCVLLSPDKKFVAFGYDAEERYRTLLLEDKENGDTSNAKAHYFFERFKIMLYQTKELRFDTTLSDAQGKELPAFEVFAVVINHIKEIIYEQLKRYTTLGEDDIIWVITIPAVWPEKIVHGMMSSTIGHQLISETTALSIHEILPDWNLNRIHRAHGDQIGGSVVNQGFSEFFKDIFGSNVMQYFGDTAAEIMESFERTKKAFDFDNPDKIRMRIPIGDLREAISELKEESIEAKIKTASERYGVEPLKLVKDIMVIEKKIMKKLFSKATNGIVHLIERMLENAELREINHLLMVGGFSESSYVQHVIKQNFPWLNVIVPAEPSLLF